MDENEILNCRRSCFLNGRSGTGKTTLLTRKLYQRRQEHLVADQVVLNQLILTVNPKIVESQLRKVGFTDEFEPLPNTFRGIGQQDHLLIMTLDRFLKILDGSLRNPFVEKFGDSFTDKEVMYEKFRSAYCPHFNDRLKKNLDCDRVFTEIISHVKGGGCHSKLNRQDYVSLSESRTSTLNKDTRDQIYDVFEDYEKKKSERNDIDVSDFVNSLHLRLVYVVHKSPYSYGSD